MSTEDLYRTKIVSGIRYVKGESSAFLIMVLTFLFVLSFYTILYVHYIRAPKYESWIPISRLNILRNSVAFARFDNRNNDDDNENAAVDVGIRYNNDDTVSDEPIVNDFNNPLFERTEEVAVGSVETEMLEPSSSQSDTDLADASTDDIKLVDINLNTSVN